MEPEAPARLPQPPLLYDHREAPGEDVWTKFELLAGSPLPAGLAADEAADCLLEPGGLLGNLSAFMLRDCMWSGFSARLERARGNKAGAKAPASQQSMATPSSGAQEPGLAAGQCVAPGAVFAWPAGGGGGGGGAPSDSKIRASSGSESPSDSGKGARDGAALLPVRVRRDRGGGAGETRFLRGGRGDPPLLASDAPPPSRAELCRHDPPPVAGAPSGQPMGEGGVPATCARARLFHFLEEVRLLLLLLPPPPCRAQLSKVSGPIASLGRAQPPPPGPSQLPSSEAGHPTGMDQL